MVSVLFGGVYGGFIGSKEAYEKFMTNHTATTFETHLEAKVNITPLPVMNKIKKLKVPQ